MGVRGLDESTPRRLRQEGWEHRDRATCLASRLL